MGMEDLRSASSHFRFGENWKSFLSTVTPETLREAERGLARLFPGDELKSRRFLDIGCGSGLSLVAAHRLGAASVDGIDIDPESIEASRALLGRYVPTGACSAKVASVFDLGPGLERGYDIVYSWGVLHHTGDLWAALERAASMVVPGGRLAVALYRRTPLCGFWKQEKRFYSAASKPVQAAIRAIYQSVFSAALLATGRNPFNYVAHYRSARGMDWRHDVHDWLGGYPYESVEPDAVTGYLGQLGFVTERVFEHPATAGGLLGSHCDEFVAARRAVPSMPQ
jgi:2-polyprenyl-6-hydroxyphenyl methylase/3-demethylubiquinone-9 3-methyltransferase